MRRRYNFRREKKKLITFFSLMIFFAVMTLLGGILVMRHDYHTLYSLIPAIPTVVFLFLCKRTRKRIERHERD
ncbi:MAG: hypothetical protein J6B86_00200 [Clostridia bacterium]|nr:hypothetical protein [Clostridia bacterium]